MTNFKNFMMKKIILLIVLTLTISCKEKENSDSTKNIFTGLGQFKIGKKIKTIENYNYFQLNSDSVLVMYDSVYYIPKYELNKEFGIVENLQLAIKDGKIFRVYFRKGPYTKHDNIKNNFDKKLILENNSEVESSTIDYFSSHNSTKASMTFTKKNIFYNYYDSGIVYDIDSKRDSINHASQRKQAQEQKEEYMKSMPK